ncbi:NAD(P)-dependent oxidoreductase [Synechococcus sp. PCC 7336]|uniref:NAD-dependent epimerase/dehydratase family protein n=1 Tax=Synechococcus sp. PCC 7336 TaxID=195250 RepID=UPI00037EF2A8|nr:NAD(P)-dependent oxidoreductase [Synechococcus sp. PCC 7336]
MGMELAIVGASGFVGSRAVEWFGLGGRATVRPIVRSYASLARVARFPLDCRIADAGDEAALTEALRGCDMLLHSVVGNPQLVVDTAAVAYRAAQAAGVRRLVFLSSASVHGQNPAAGTDETSPLSDRQYFAYNNAKVRAERKLQQLRRNGAVELVILRPSIVFGPRSRWVLELAKQLLEGSAYLVNGGTGICNSIYVDNLLQAVELAATVAGIDGEVFLVGDRERVTWAEFYAPFARAFGVELDSLLRPEAPAAFHKSWRDRLGSLRAAPATQALLPLFPSRLKQLVKGAIAGWQQRPRPSGWRMPAPASPQVPAEIACLQQCQYSLPWDKARRLMGYEPTVSFEEGCRRSIGWLDFAGYPVVHHDD